MGAVADKLTLAEYERQYGDRKPYHEYWFGEAVPKAMPATTHGLLQKIGMRLLDQEGYVSASEVRLKISPDFEPIPDVIATRGLTEFPYPTRPVEVVVEILSPEDSFQRLIRKCRLYGQWGIPKIFVLDPDDREAWQWNQAEGRLDDVTLLEVGDRDGIPVARIFEELDQDLARLTPGGLKPPQPAA